MQIPPPSAMRSALEGLQRAQDRLARDAQYVANASDMDPEAEASAPATDTTGESAPQDMTGAMVDILIAQRAFAAQLRVVKTADAMTGEVLDLTKRERG